MALAGKGGTVKWSSSTGGTPAIVASLRQWSLNVQADQFEISSFGSSGWKEFQPNLNGAQGSISGYWDVVSSTEMAAVQNHILAQSINPATMDLLVDNANGNGYTGSVFVTGISPGAAVDGIVEFNADFTYTGAVAYSTTL